MDDAAHDIHLCAAVYDANGQRVVKSSANARFSAAGSPDLCLEDKTRVAEELGQSLARTLIEMGAEDILRKCKGSGERTLAPPSAAASSQLTS